MKPPLSDAKLIVRFTVHFILHQFLLLSFVALPAIVYLYILHLAPSGYLYTRVMASITLVFYVLYCLFYGAYVAFPMVEIIVRIKRLASGTYLPPDKEKKFRRFFSRLYREVYSNLDMLSATLQENERKRQEFEKLRQEWAAGITHDLKTPLSYISGYTDMLLSAEHEWNAEEKKEFLQHIRSKSAHMKELIDDLGIAFRMDQSIGIMFSDQRIELVELIRRVVAETANMPAVNGNTFEILGEEEPLYTMGDAALLKRAFSNLLVNAVVHNPAGTAISVQIHNRTYIEIQVTDNGKGMDDLHVQHLFDRYYRGTSTDIPAGGTGLGMAIVKQIVTAHRGTVAVKSKLGHGTSIAIRLPNDSNAAENRSYTRTQM